MQKKAIFWLIILMVSNIPSIYYGWYLKVDWFDAVQHFLGGFFIAMLMTGYLRDHLLPKNELKNILIIAGVTVLIGMVWEFSEYIANQTLIEPFERWFGIRAYFMGNLEDTIIDFLMDILGALSFSCLHLIWRRNSH